MYAGLSPTCAFPQKIARLLVTYHGATGRLAPCSLFL
jgi:hypothetical protein